MRRAAVAAAALAALAAAAVVLGPGWLWHPLGYCTGGQVAVRDCESYNFWSGISGSNITLPVAAAAYAAGWWHQHNCHVQGCMRLQWHPHPEHGHPVCRRHFPSDAPSASETKE